MYASLYEGFFDHKEALKKFVYLNFVLSTKITMIYILYIYIHVFIYIYMYIILTMVVSLTMPNLIKYSK